MEEEDKFKQMMKELVIPIQPDWLNKLLTDVSDLEGQDIKTNKIIKQ